MRSVVALGVSIALSILLHFAALTQFWAGMKTPRSPRSQSQTVNKEILRFSHIAVSVKPIVNEAQNSFGGSAGPQEAPKRPQLAFDSKNYLTTDSLHTRAVPKTDWILKNELLPANKFTSLRFTVWVSAEGAIDHLEPEGAEPQPSWLPEALFYLKKTAMEPATLNDQAVASRMTVEILIESTDK